MRTTDWLAGALLLLALGAAGARAQDGSAGADAGEAAAPEAEKREPITNIGGNAPEETPQQRMERFKRERGAGSDKPFEGFAKQAEADMQRQRDAAIAGSGAPGGGATNAADASLEQEILKDDEEAAENRARAREQLADKLAKLGGGAWGATPCFENAPDLGDGDDWIRHRTLTRGDFLSQKQENAKLAVRVPNSVVGAYVAVAFSCTLHPVVTQVREGLWAAEVSDADFFAVLSRRGSWWNDTLPESGDKYTLGHEQLHFDIADTFMRWMNANRKKILQRMRGSGHSPQEAIGKLQLEWAKMMLAVDDDFDAIETAYDRQTKHGTILEQQTFWTWRVRDGMPAIEKEVKLRVRKYVD